MNNTVFSRELTFSCQIPDLPPQTPLWSLRNTQQGIPIRLSNQHDHYYLSKPYAIHLYQEQNDKELFGNFCGERFKIHTSWLTKTIQELSTFFLSEKSISNPHYIRLFKYSSLDEQIYHSIKNTNHKITIFDGIQYLFLSYMPVIGYTDYDTDTPKNKEFCKEKPMNIRKILGDLIDDSSEAEAFIQDTTKNINAMILQKETDILSLYAQTHIIPLLSHPAP